MAPDDELKGWLEDPAVWVEPDPGLEDRVVAAIAREVAASPGPAAIVPLRSVRARRPRRRHVVMGIAAAAVLAVGTAALVSRDATDAPRVQVALAATGLVPDARGDATMTKTASGWRIELDATGLPRLEDGRFYQAWLLDADGLAVPVGTFNEGEHVTLWAGVSPLDFPTFGITEEQADGEQGSSGRRVLSGTIDELPPSSVDQTSTP
jgi:anti-sigma-K factor RskA